MNSDSSQRPFFSFIAFSTQDWEIGLVLEQLDQDLWVISREQKFLGMNFNSRMTVVRLSGGRLILHSPTLLIPALRDELHRLGKITYLVAPNLLHHKFIKAWKQSEPAARVFAAPGLQKKRKDLVIDVVLGEKPEVEWQDEIDQVLVAGMPRLNETAFFHKPSRTLILTDLAFHFQIIDSLWMEVFLQMNDAYRKLGLSRLGRLMITDHQQFRASIDRILAWQADRLILSHGELIRSGATARLKEAFAWSQGKPQGLQALTHFVRNKM